MRKSLAFLRGLLVILPILGIALCAVSYLRSCLNSVLAPGIPVILKLATPGGQVTFSADSYSFSPRAGYLLLTDPRLIDPNGVSIVNADRVDIRGIDLFDLSRSALTIRASRVTGTLIRNSDGRFEIQSLIPTPTNRTKGVPFDVAIDEADVQVIDNSGSSQWVRHLKASDVSVAGLGQKWLAGGSFVAIGSGSGWVSAAHQPDGVLVIHGRAEDFDLVDIGRHVLTTLPSARDYRTMDATRVKATGPLDVVIAPKTAPHIRFSGNAELQGFRFAGYTAATASFRGDVSESAVSGHIAATNHGLNAQLDGSISWGRNGIVLAGNGTTNATSLAALPPPIAKMLPAGLDAGQVSYTGSIGFDSRDGVVATGRLLAKMANYKQDKVSNVAGNIRVNGARVWAQVGNAVYDGAKVSTELAVDWKAKNIAGSIRGSNIEISKLLARFPDTAKSITGSPEGKLAAYALLSGRIDKPDVDFRITGSGSYLEADLPHRLNVDRLLVRGKYHDGQISIERLRARTPAGSIAAKGTVDVHNRTLAIDVDGRGLDVADFSDSITGLASVSGVVGGSFDKPKFNGQVEAYNLSYQGSDFELVTGEVSAGRAGIDASRLDVIIGSSQLSGSLAIDLPSHALSGQFSAPNFQLGDLIGDAYGGLVSIKTTEIGGTLQSPIVAVSLTGKDLLAQELPISNVTANAALHGKKLTLDSLHANTVNGTVDATGSYDLDARVGVLAAQGKGLDLAGMVPMLQQEVRGTIAGSLNGDLNLTFAQDAISNLTATGSIQGVKVNGTDLGQGVWNLSGNPRRLSGSAQTSFGTRFLAIENGTIDLDSETLDADVVESSLTIQNLYQSIVPFLSDASQSAIQKLALLDGDVRVKSHLAGKWRNPDLTVSDLEANKVTYNGVPFGDLTASAKRTGGNWDIANLHLADGAALTTVHGTIEGSGNTNLDGEFGNLDISKLINAFGGGSNFGGVLSGSFLATGPSSSPLIRASLNAESATVNGRVVDFGLDLDTVAIDGKSIEASGAVTMQGFHGQLTAAIPFTYPFSIPDGAPISANLKLNQRPLSDIAPYATDIDPKRIQGALNGSLAITGTKDSLHLSGGLSATAPVLGLRAPDPNSKPKAPKYIAIATELRDVIVSLGVQDDTVTADVSAKSSVNGAVDGQAKVKLPALEDMLAGRGLPDLESWLTGSLTGNISFADLGAKESNSLVKGAVALNGALTLGGVLSAPAIGGSIDLTNLSMSVPNISSQTGVASTPVVDPQFNVYVNLVKPGRITTSLASIDLSGHGHVGGSLSQPDTSAALVVVKGDLRLPGGQVRLEPGGSVRPTYQADSSGTPVAHVLVDLLGTGHVTAVRNGDIAERYDVHLDVMGDLLAPDQVVFSATSDPPDLSQDQILSLLGRTDLLTALGSGNSYSQGERNIQTAAFGYAIPSLLDPFTAKLAADLGLDYISVEYNALDQTSLLAAKTLGHGFSIQARRQISEATFGVPLSYDYRLVYQLPLGSRLVRRFSLFFGRDELTQWKFGFQYGQRF